MSQLLEHMILLDLFDDLNLFNKLSEKFFLRMVFDLATVFILIRMIYYPIYRKADLFMTFFTFNIIIFLITFLFNKVEMSIGAAFGLFAVFSMLRYRTEGLSAKDMTYLFVVIAIGLLSAITKGSWDELSLINGLILLSVQLLEGNWLIKREYSKTILYDKIEWIAPEHRDRLLHDLRERTGLNIHRVQIDNMDFLRDSAHMTIYYFQSEKTLSQPKKKEEKSILPYD